MVDMLRIGGALLGGICLGAFFFLGLWWTVQRGVAAVNPAPLFLGSVLVRTLVTVAGFYYLSSSDWRNLVASLAGFLFARFVITRQLGSQAPPTARFPLGEVQ
jgi:F1F0 ATPase subunit 2